MMEYLHVISPKEIVMSMFLIFISIMFGLAAVIANVVGGYVYEAYGGKTLFESMSVVYGVWTFVLVGYYGYLRFIGKRTSQGQQGAVEFHRENKDVPEMGIDNVVTNDDDVTALVT